MTTDEMKAQLELFPKGATLRPKARPRMSGVNENGETCGSCKHLCAVRYSKTYHKCGLNRDRWTCGNGSDIRKKDIACNLWERSEQ